MVHPHYPLDTFPNLEPQGRDREYNEYPNEDVRAALVYLWLVDGMPTRALDVEILHSDVRYHGKTTNGWKSFGILHYLGLTGEHRGYFKGVSPFQVLSVMYTLCKDEEHWLIYQYLHLYITGREIDNSKIWDVDAHDRELEQKEEERSQKWIRNVWIQDVAMAQYDEKLLALPDAQREVVIHDVLRFYSDQTLKETVKDLYDFRCQVCGDVIYRHGWMNSQGRCEQWNHMSADIHHIVPLAKKGPDIRSNMICLCPSCHRKFHSGEYRLIKNGNTILCRDELLGLDHDVKKRHQMDFP